METHLASWCSGSDGGAEFGRQEVRGGGLRVCRLLRGHRGRYELIRSESGPVKKVFPRTPLLTDPDPYF